MTEFPLFCNDIKGIQRTLNLELSELILQESGNFLRGTIRLNVFATEH